MIQGLKPLCHSAPEVIQRGKSFVPARIRTQNSWVTVSHSNHVAKELTQERGCYEWHCHYTLPPLFPESGPSTTTVHSPLPLPEANSGTTELPLPPVIEVIQRGKSFGPARIRTQNSCVTVDYSNHVAKTQQRGC